MAEVTEVIHKISYEVDNTAIVNATKAIEQQIKELNALGKAVNGYIKQLNSLSSVQASEISSISRKVDQLNNKILQSTSKTSGALKEVFKGIQKGITGNEGIKDVVAEYVEDVKKKFKELENTGEEVAVGFAQYMKGASASGKAASGSLIKSVANLTKSMAGSVNVTGLAIDALFLFGQTLLDESGILDRFVNKQKEALSETQKIINSYGNITERVGELASEELAHTKTLYETATNINNSYGERLNAVNKLQEQYPAYFGNLSKEAILAGKAAKKYDELKNAILAKAAVEVYEEELKELIKQEKILDERVRLANERFKWATISISKDDRGQSPFLKGKYDKAEINRNNELEKIEFEKKKNLEAQNEIITSITEKQKLLTASAKEELNTRIQTEQVYKEHTKRNNEQPLEKLPTRAPQIIDTKPEPGVFKTVEVPENEDDEKEKFKLSDIRDKLDVFKDLSDEERQNIRNKIDDYQQLANAALEAYNTITQAQINALDKEISVREKRVEKARELAEKGNTEVLKAEEERLRKAQEMRARFARRQQVINAAITLSNSIAAVARAALEGGGFGSAATIAALIAALAAGYAAVQSLSSSGSEAFADGVVGYNGKGGPRDDKNWVRISSGESVITAAGTQNNYELLQAINNGARFQIADNALPMFVPEWKQSNNTQHHSFASKGDLGKLEQKLDEVVYAIEDNKLRQDIFFNEQGVGIMTERAVNRNRKRWI